MRLQWRPRRLGKLFLNLFEGILAWYAQYFVLTLYTISSINLSLFSILSCKSQVDCEKILSLISAV